MSTEDERWIHGVIGADGLRMEWRKTREERNELAKARQESGERIVRFAWPVTGDPAEAMARAMERGELAAAIGLPRRGGAS